MVNWIARACLLENVDRVTRRVRSTARAYYMIVPITCWMHVTLAVVAVGESLMSASSCVAAPYSLVLFDMGNDEAW